MAKSVSGGYTDTPIEGVSSLPFARGLVNFGKDFRVKSNKNGQEVVMTNLTAQPDRPELIRIAYSELANIYSGTGVELPNYAPTKRGLSILAQCTEILSVTDDTDPSFRIDLPLSAHIVIRTPLSEYVTPAHYETLVGRLLSSLYDTGSTGTTRLAAILRGALVPFDV